MTLMILLMLTPDALMLVVIYMLTFRNVCLHFSLPALGLICPEVKIRNQSMSKSEKKGPEAMKPLLRHSIGQHDLKTVIRSNFRPETAEK